jgi:hypothetical protein
MVHITLAQLRNIPGSGSAEAAWAASARQHGWLSGPEAGAAACDATVVPIVTGHLDPAALFHLVPRAEGGPTALHNLVPLCTFHHLVVIHRWDWTLTLHPDGTTTATSPDGRILRSHGPPSQAA